MSESPAEYDLEERTFKFALAVRNCISSENWSRAQWPDVDQLLRSSGSVASNYYEANNAATKPEFRHRISICKRESAESQLWLRLLGTTSTNEPAKKVLRTLFMEADELTKIFGAIYRKSND